jgi:hypothetical protein
VVSAAIRHHRQRAARPKTQRQLRAAFENVILPQLRKFSPELIIVPAFSMRTSAIRWPA